MAGKPEDLRIRRTHKLLCDAMFALLEKKSFDEISVVEICEKAMVHRATFYKHFEDKYDFMEYVAKEKIREFYEKSTEHKTFETPMEMYHAIIENVIHFIEKNRKMLRISVKSSDNNNFFESLHNIIYQELYEFLADPKKTDLVFTIPVEIVAQYLTGGLSSIVRWWIINEDAYTKEQMTYYIEALLSKNESFYVDTLTD